MKEIRAFVGHSFLSADADLVNKFLNYFDRISNLHPAFVWQSAEAAEPKELAAKVLSLIDGKNVFIGICTKRERTVNSDLLSPTWLQLKYLKGKEVDFEWKASDWIIQEIGLAKGRGLELILLVEEGLRKPGGLQGDVEYILFDRAAPEKSFNKILEMITALSPKPLGPSTMSADRVPPSEAQEQPAISGDASWMTPTATWQRADYERAMFRMIISDNERGAEEINRAYFASTDAGDGDNRAIWEARTEWFRLKLGKGGDLGKLRDLANKHRKNSKILEYLARAYAEYGDHAEAARNWEAAAQATGDVKEKDRLVGNTAVQYLRAGLNERAAAIVKQQKLALAAGATDELRLLKVCSVIWLT